MSWNNLGLFLLILLAWFSLGRWVLPRFGIETCMSGSCAISADESFATPAEQLEVKPIKATLNVETKKMNGLLELSDTNFENEVLNSPHPVLVDFSATWCGPCKMLAPIIEELASENSGSVKVGKLDIDNNSNTASQYGINSIPTVMIFKDGRVVDTLVGLQPKSRIQAALDRAGKL